MATINIVAIRGLLFLVKFEGIGVFEAMAILFLKMIFMIVETVRWGRVGGGGGGLKSGTRSLKKL